MHNSISPHATSKRLDVGPYLSGPNFPMQKHFLPSLTAAFDAYSWWVHGPWKSRGILSLNCTYRWMRHYVGIMITVLLALSLHLKLKGIVLRTSLLILLQFISKASVNIWSSVTWQKICKSGTHFLLMGSFWFLFIYNSAT